MKRHDEYVLAFEEFAKKARSLKVDRILVAGDIVHSKTQGITPELIQHLVWWFGLLAEIAPTIITLGNHDGLILNRSRMDAITPIINALKNDRIIYLRDTTTWYDEQFDTVWSNFSCFDEDKWKDLKPVEGKTNIAIFHGAVSGAVTDSEWALDEGEVEGHMFNGFDFAMLGDIHKFQYLDKQGRIAYPGSTIQQNFGETEDKGFLLWDICDKDNWKSERHLITSPPPFITLDWQGSVSETAKLAYAKRKGSRFRIASSIDLMQDEIKQFAEILKNECQAIEIAWKIESAQASGTINFNDSSIEKENLRDHKTQMSLLRKYFPADEFDDISWKEIGNLIEKHLTVINENEQVKNSKWSIRRMAWDNTFVYGKENVIDFDKLHGVVGLFGANRTGKSSVPGTLMYALYNSTDRGSVKNIHIVNARKGYCKTSVDVSIDGKTYRINRQTNKHTNKKGQTHAWTNMGVHLLNEAGEEIFDLTGEQRSDSDKLLRNLIGTADDFLLTSFASQGEMNTFVKAGASARKHRLGNFLDLGIFEQISNHLKSDSVVLKGAIKASNVDFEKEIETVTRLFKEEQDKIVEHSKSVENLRKTQTDLTVSLATHREKGIVTQHDVDQFSAKVSAEEVLIRSIESRLARIVEEIETSSVRSSKIEKLRENFPIKALRDEISLLNDLEKAEARLSASLDKEKVISKNQEKSVSRLSEVPCGDSFPTCKFISDSHRDKKLLEKQKQIIATVAEELKSTSASVRQLREKSLHEKYEKYEKYLKEESLLREKMSSLERERTMTNCNKVDREENLGRMRNELSSLRLRVVDSDVGQEVEKVKRKIIETTELLKRSQNALDHSNRQVGMYQARLVELKRSREEFEEKRRKWKIYESLLQAYGKNGIPLMIIAAELPKINAEVAKILHGITNFDVILEADPDNSDLELYLDYGDSRRPIELGSGMEKMLASLAIRVALTNVSALPKSDILIIDEGFGALDDTNVEACNRLLRSLTRYFKSILVISHVDAVKEAVDTMVEITHNGKDSHVVFE
jgi:DNA repair exonuclease SbcCD ATPase subunit/DNA repair exonuclease SbcCD nuclease subunit